MSERLTAAIIVPALNEEGNVADLVAEVRESYPDLPIVLTSVEPGIEWVEVEGPHRVTPIAGQPSPDELRQAVGSALADQGMAV